MTADSLAVCPKITDVPKPVRSRIKACEHCKVVSTTLYRIIHDQTASWALICNECRVKVQEHPCYRYGGTWKSDKRH